MSSSLIPSCGTCRFARLDKEGELNCCRHPPLPFLDTTDEPGKYRVISAFPVVTPELWCAEWERENAPDD